MSDEPRLGSLKDELWRIMKVSEESYGLLGDLYSFTCREKWITPAISSGDPLRDFLWSFMRSRKRRVLASDLDELQAIVTRDWITSERFAHILENPSSNRWLSAPRSDSLEKRIFQTLIFSPRHLAPQWVRSLYEETLARNDGDTLRTNLELTILVESEKLQEI